MLRFLRIISYMREIDFNEVKEIWKKNVSPIGVYIHSAFCESTCSYCVYKGVQSNEETESWYYNEYLPNQIKRYQEVLDKQEIQSFYFGGGTPNHRGSIEQLTPSMELLNPYIARSKEAAIELHMGYEIPEEQIIKLKEWGVTTVILCTQTFDTDILHKEHRIVHFNSEDYKKHVDRVSGLCRKYGIKTGMDLLCFADYPEGMKVTQSDIDTILSFENPVDEVSISLLYQERTVDTSSKFLEEVYEKFRNSLKYRPEVPPSFFKIMKNVRFFKNDINMENFFSFVKFLEDSESFVYDVSTLGIGSFCNPFKQTFSNINQVVTILEKCLGYKQEPKYFIAREISYWDKVRNSIDFLEDFCKGQNPPRDIEFVFKNCPLQNLYKDTQDEPIFLGFNVCKNRKFGEELNREFKRLEADNLKLLAEIQLKKRG